MSKAHGMVGCILISIMPIDLEILSAILSTCFVQDIFVLIVKHKKIKLSSDSIVIW